MYVCLCRKLTENETRSLIAVCPHGIEDIDRFLEEFDYLAGRAQCHACHTQILELLEEHTKTARE